MSTEDDKPVGVWCKSAGFALRLGLIVTHSHSYYVTLWCRAQRGSGTMSGIHVSRDAVIIQHRVENSLSDMGELF